MIIESLYAPCLICKYLKKGFVCDAFPYGIPDEILSGDNRHLEPLPDQKNNIVFEPIKDED